MSAQGDLRPIIIKRKKKGGGDGHHGGAWKVAYADFVTAMMAFFMLMWLLNATTEKQRKGIADYFSPTIAINRVSGGGDGAFGGNSVFSEETLPQNGTGASSQRPTTARQARGQTGGSDNSELTEAQDEVFKSLDARLQGKGGESTVMENEIEHIITKVTDEGFIIEVFALPNAPIFERDGITPTTLLKNLAKVIVESTRIVSNGFSIEGYVPTQPIVIATNSVWSKSSDQATAMRILLEKEGIDPSRMLRVTGHADREPTVENPMAIRNNRIEIILLREE
ncbi:MAG: flagellar motor protein MotB [Paracoccaceae bacterium]